MTGGQHTTALTTRTPRVLSRTERQVLALLHSGALSRAELARRTGLSAQAMTRIVRALVADRLVRALPPSRGQVGQPSIPLAIDPRGAYAVGVAAGRRGGEATVIDFAGNSLATLERDWRWPEPDGVIDFAVEACRALSRRVPRERLYGLGLSMPSELWQWHERLDVAPDALAPWRVRDVAGELEALVGLPVSLGNDAAAACGAELTFGRGVELGDFAHFSVGFFVGGGLVMNGAVHAGRHGRGAAFGSLPVPDGSNRRTGAAQLIDEASLHVLETMIAEAACVDTGTAGATPADTWSAAPEVLERWERRAAEALATAIAAVAATVDIDHAVIDGALPTPVRTRLCSRVRTALRALDTRGLNVPPIVEGTLGGRGQAMGAARLALSPSLLPEGLLPIRT